MSTPTSLPNAVAIQRKFSECETLNLNKLFDGGRPTTASGLKRGLPHLFVRICRFSGRIPVSLLSTFLVTTQLARYRRRSCGIFRRTALTCSLVESHESCAISAGCLSRSANQTRTLALLPGTPPTRCTKSVTDSNIVNINRFYYN